MDLPCCGTFCGRQCHDSWAPSLPSSIRAWLNQRWRMGKQLVISPSLCQIAGACWKSVELYLLLRMLTIDDETKKKASQKRAKVRRSEEIAVGPVAVIENVNASEREQKRVQAFDGGDEGNSLERSSGGGIGRFAKWARAIAIVKEFEEQCGTPIGKLRQVADAMTVEMHAGLASEGGTNFRVIRAHFGGEGIGVVSQEFEEVSIPPHLMTGSSDALFDFIVSVLAKFVDSEPEEFHPPSGSHPNNPVPYSLKPQLHQPPTL